MTSAPAHTHIEATRGWRLPDAREALRFRDLLWILIARDIKVRYKQTMLGVIWIVLQPLLAAGVFSVVFGAIGGLDDDAEGPPYFLLAFVGMTCWTLFSQVLTKSTNVLVQNAHLVSKIYFPRVLLPLSVTVGALLDFLIVLGIVVGVVLAFWRIPAAALVGVPLAALLAMTLSFGIGAIGGALAVRYRDVRYLMPMAVQLGLWISPVAYPVSAIESRTPELLTLFYLNPMTSIVQLFRSSMLGTTPPPAGWLVYSTVFTICACFAGLLVFRRLERGCADVI